MKLELELTAPEVEILEAVLKLTMQDSPHEDERDVALKVWKAILLARGEKPPWWAG